MTTSASEKPGNVKKVHSFVDSLFHMYFPGQLFMCHVVMGNNTNKYFLTMPGVSDKNWTNL